MGSYLKVYKGDTYSNNQYFLFFIAVFKEYPFFYKESIFDPPPENCFSFSQKLPQKIF